MYAVQVAIFTCFSLAANTANCATPINRNKAPTCRNIPGDSDWPSTREWNALNATVGGRLIATVPLAHVCHDPTYDEALCDYVTQNWDYSYLITPLPAEIWASWFQNNSCSPFTNRSTPCELGNQASFSVNVSGVQDIVSGLAFAQNHNIRLVVKNTGHDFYGNSQGKGALSLWTHNLKSKQLIQSYNASYYRGFALKIGAGVQGGEAVEFATQAGYRMVTGSCSTVGVAGGFTQGGGHSFLSGLYGFGADNVLEWEVVTASGEHLVATPTTHSDLYWALSGGGGGTYGVVVSMTVRVFPDGQTAIATMSFNMTTAGGEEPFWDAFSTFMTQLQPLTDRGLVALFDITNSSVQLAGLMAPGYTSAELLTLLSPMISALSNTSRSLTAQSMSLTVSEGNSYESVFEAVVAPETVNNLASPVTGGRFISRSNMANNMNDVMAALRTATDSGKFLVSGVVLNSGGPERVAAPVADNAVQQGLKDAFIVLILSVVWSWEQPWSDATLLQEDLWNVVMPPLVDATPGAGGAYINEANWQQPDWQTTFYGANYERLRAVKAAYDPANLLYGLVSVGSEAWESDTEGRLCKTGL